MFGGFSLLLACLQNIMFYVDNKFGAVKTEYNGYVFDSKKEAARAQELDLLIKAKEVVSVVYQPKFDCVVNGKKICTYKADFKVMYKDGHEEIEDVKGFKTPVYKLKKKLVGALFNVEIKEI